MFSMNKHLMPICDVADVLQVCANRVRQLDDELQPIRRPNGQRRYDPAIVARVAEQRRKARP